MTKLSVIIINYNTTEMTEKVIRNFFVQEPDLKTEMILIDNNSPEGFDRGQFEKLSDKLIANPKNLGFARAVNQGIEAASGDFVLLLNSDVFINKKSISSLLEYMQGNPGAGIIGPKMVFPDGRFQPSFGRTPTLLSEFIRFASLHRWLPGGTITLPDRWSRQKLNTVQEVDWLSGGCMLLRKELIKDIGMMDSEYFLGVEDIDYCFRAREAGWQVVYNPETEVVHYHGFSSGGTRSVMRFKFDKLGIIRFFTKHFPEKMLTRVLVAWMYNIKILLTYLRDKIKAMITPAPKPKDITMAVTWRCNSRCRMCNIWQEQNPADLPLESIKHLSSRAKYINVSGGEPFLHPDLPGVIRRIKQASPKAKVIISTNGYATDYIAEQMAEIMRIDPRIGVRVSLDGNRATHDSVRGVKGMYDQALSTTERLRGLGVKNLGFSFTIMGGNACELKDVYDLASSRGLQLALALVQNSDIYFQKQDNNLTDYGCVESGLKYVIKNEMGMRKPKSWFRSYYDYGLLYFAKYGKRLLPSGAGFDSLFIDADGTVYPSNLINMPMGNINTANLDTIWKSGQSARVRQDIIRNLVTESWIICTIRGQIKRHWFRVGKWVAINKLKSLLGKPLI